MGFLRRRGGKGKEDDEPLPELTEEQQEQVEEVIKDNLSLMKEVVMRIREDEDYAKNMYSNCPRLQHLLDQYPDLRVVFQDPKMIRINFEQVYRDAGGVLPEDEEKKPSCFTRFVNSPIFKVLKVLLFVKKLLSCVAGGGFAFATGLITGCCFEDALEEIEGDADPLDDIDLDPNKEALNHAADYMEDPEVQEKMQELLEQDPDELQDSIENDEELRVLRDSNPLCEELMKDPETLKCLTDPDNLRALADAPDLIEADFIDPDGFDSSVLENQVEGGYDTYDGAYDTMDVGEGLYDDVELGEEDIEYDDGEAAEGEGEDEEEEEEEGIWNDAELEEQDRPDTQASKSASKSKARNTAKKTAQDTAEEGAQQPV